VSVHGAGAIIVINGSRTVRKDYSFFLYYEVNGGDSSGIEKNRVALGAVVAAYENAKLAANFDPQNPLLHGRNSSLSSTDLN